MEKSTIKSIISVMENTINTYNIDYPLHVEVGKNIKIVVAKISNSKDYQDFDELT